MSSHARRVAADDDFAVATLDNYVVLLWRRRVTTTGALALREAFTFLHESPDLKPIGFLTVLERNCALSTSPEVRDLISATLRDHASEIAATAVSYEVTGFWAAVVRSIITGINLASRATFASMVFADTEASIDWLTKQLGGDRMQSNHVRFVLNVLRVPSSLGSNIDLG